MKQLNKWVALLSTSALILTLSACKIESNASVSDKAKVKYTTTYDVSSVIEKMKPYLATLKDGDDLINKISCDGLNKDLKDKVKCKDVSKGVISLEGEIEGNSANGVTLDESNQEVRVDAVRLFKALTDVKPPKMDAVNISEQSLVPVSADKVEQYRKEGMILTLNLTMPSEIVSVDGQPAQNIKNNAVSINFLDIAGKNEYVILSKQSASGSWGRWLFIIVGLMLLVGAVLFLLKRQKKAPTTPPAPIVPPVAAESATDMDAYNNKPTVMESTPVVTDDLPTEAMEHTRVSTDPVQDVVATEDTDVKKDEPKA